MKRRLEQQLTEIRQLDAVLKQVRQAIERWMRDLVARGARRTTTEEIARLPHEAEYALVLDVVGPLADGRFNEIIDDLADDLLVYEEIHGVWTTDIRPLALPPVGDRELLRTHVNWCVVPVGLNRAMRELVVTTKPLTHHSLVLWPEDMDWLEVKPYKPSTFLQQTVTPYVTAWMAFAQRFTPATVFAFGQRSVRYTADLSVLQTIYNQVGTQIQDS